MTNYRGHPTATVFKLPKGPRELRDKWITALHRDKVGELSENNIFICINHFREEDIIRVDLALQAIVLFLKYHVLDLPTALTLFQLFFKAVYLISLQHIRRQSVLDSINLEIQVLQSIVFIGGYAVFSYLKTTNCHNCILQLTENKDIEISETTKYDLVRYIDRGSLKWPSDIVI